MRKFSKSQKQILYTSSKGVCTLCKKQLTKSWHADHIIPYSKGGNTAISNGQALCQKCNLKKSDKMKNLELREWQKEAISVIDTKNKGGQKSALINACPGAGKTIMAVMATKLFPDFRIIIVSPSEEIKRNWSQNFKKHLKLDIDFKYSFTYDFIRQFSGISITYQSLTKKNVEFLLINRIINKNTIIICDEIHHAGDNKSWGEAIKEIGDACGFVLSLTGTPERSDNARIPFCDYKPDINKNGEFDLKTDYSRLYRDEIGIGGVCPIDFNQVQIKHNGKQGRELETSKTDIQILNAALRVSTSEFVFDAYTSANNKLLEIRENSNAAGLVVCNSIEDAKDLHKLIPEAEIVTSDDVDAAKRISLFRRSQTNWLIAVKMISEGVDIDRIRVIVYASNITTKMYLVQVTGRGIRNCSGADDFCHVFMPDYEPLNRIAEDIKEEMAHKIELMRQAEEREYSERSEAEENRYIGDFFNGEIGGFINNGNIIDTKENMLLVKPLADQYKVKEELIRDILAIGRRVQREESEPETTKTERVEQIKSLIKKKVSRIHHLLNNKIDYREINIELNSRVGVLTTSNTKDLNLLNRKLTLAQQWISEIY